jgi:hypothetical protein
MGPTTIAIVDDHRVVGRSLQAYLESFPDLKVAELGQIVESLARSDVVEIERLSSRLGSTGRSAAKGALVGAGIGLVSVLAACGGLGCGPQPYLGVMAFGGLLGTGIGAGLAKGEGSNTPDIIYRAR